MKKFLLILAMMWMCFASSPRLIYVAAATGSNTQDYSSVDDDLAGFGLTSDKNYIADNNSHQEPSTLIFAETKTEDKYYCYFYLYLPQANIEPYSSYLFQSLQISYLSTNNKEALEDNASLTSSTLYYSLKLIDTSVNGTVYKFLVEGMENANRLKYRRYCLRQVKYVVGSAGYTPEYQILGDDFYYETLENGNTYYEWQKMNYLTIKNKVVYSYLISTNNDVWNDFFHTPHLGGEYWFYGFTPNGFEIDTLMEVSMDYYLSDIKCYKPHSDISVKFFNNSLGDASYSANITNTIYKNVIIKPEEIDQEWYKNFFQQMTFSWNRIAKQSEAVKTDNAYFKNFIKNHFKESEWIVQFFEADYTYTSKERTCARYSEYGSFCNYLESYGSVSYISQVSPSGTGNYYEYNSKYVDEVSITRLKFKSEGKTYDLNVITNPISSSGQVTPGKDKEENIFTWLLDLFKKLAKWIQETFEVSEVVSYILAILVTILAIALAISMLFALAKAIVKWGFSAIIKVIFGIIFFIPRIIFNKKPYWMWSRKEE